MRFCLLALLRCLTQAQTLTPEVKKQLDYTRAHYTKYEFRIPMRGVIKLFTAVYAPKDLSPPYPIIMQRTPYSVGPYGVDNYKTLVGPSEPAEKEGFIFAYPDVRGRYLSEGTFIDVPPHKTSRTGKETDESTDTYDTVDWLIKNVPNNKGRVGMWGISYPGFFAACGLMNSPALKAVSPQAPMGDVGNGDDTYYNGAFHLSGNFGFYVFFKPRGPDPETPQSAAKRSNRCWKSSGRAKPPDPVLHPLRPGSYAGAGKPSEPHPGPPRAAKEFAVHTAAPDAHAWPPSAQTPAHLPASLPESVGGAKTVELAQKRKRDSLNRRKHRECMPARPANADGVCEFNG